MRMTEEQKKERREARKEEKRIKAETERKEREKNQKHVEKMDISIEWRKSRTWGSNPYADTKIWFKDGSFERVSFTTSGCGYDKESTVIASAFNHVLKYKLYEERESFKNPPYGLYFNDYRHFSDGIGTDCYYRISEAIGGKFERLASGKTFDVYRYTDIED